MFKAKVATKYMHKKSFFQVYFLTNCNLFCCICGETKSNPAKIRHFGTCYTVFA